MLIQIEFPSRDAAFLYSNSHQFTLTKSVLLGIAFMLILNKIYSVIKQVRSTIYNLPVDKLDMLV